MNYNQFYKKKDKLKRRRNAEERANLMRIAKVFAIFLLSGAAIGGIIILFSRM